MPPPAPTPAWQALADHHRAAAGSHLRDLLGDDKRTEALTFALGGLCLDLSKNRLTPDTLTLLIALADERGVAARRDAMAAGEAINTTEDRAALHMALRARPEDGFAIGGTPVHGEGQAVLDHMADFVARVEADTRAGAAGKPFTDVVNIGIGGSHLGPRIDGRALSPIRKPHLKHALFVRR